MAEALENSTSMTPAEPGGEPVVQAPEPSQPDTGDDESGHVEKAEVTPREAIERAFKKMRGEGEGEGDADDEGDDRSDDRPRNPDVTFKAKQPENQEGEPGQPEQQKRDLNTPPERFSPDAKKEWAKAPLSVRAEVTRAMDEMNNGLQAYQHAYEPFRQLDNHLRQTGQNFQDVMARYVGIEHMLATDPYQGLETICRNLGTSLQEVAEAIVGIEPDEYQQQTSNALYALQQENAYLRQFVGNMSQQQQAQHTNEVFAHVEQFAADKPRFTELADDIVWLITTGRTSDLQAAYDMAERLRPASDGQQPANGGQAAAQTRNKGRLSVSGSPASGSNPVHRKPASSARDAVKDAFAKVGLTG